MKTVWAASALLVLSALSVAPPATAQWELECEVTTAAPARVSVYTLPGGEGNPLSSAYLWDGGPGSIPATVDATITLTLIYFGDPVYGYPREDMWLESLLDNLVLCPGGSIADRNTDINGQTTFSGSLRAGGATDPDAGELTIVMISGSPCPTAGLDVQFNSPDMNGDLIVNLTDVVLFAPHYLGEYSYAADFYWDGVVNLSDLVKLAQGMLVACP